MIFICIELFHDVLEGFFFIFFTFFREQLSQVHKRNLWFIRRVKHLEDLVDVLFRHDFILTHGCLDELIEV